jgi:hypothetical protein
MPIRHLNDVATRLRAVGLHPAVVHDIVTQIEKWEKCNGPEWTVARLKSLKTDFVRHLALTGPVGSYAKKTVRIKGRLYRLPKGIYGRVFVLGLQPKGRRMIHRVWQVMIAYTKFQSSVVTHRQWVKFSSAVRKPEPTKPEMRKASAYVALGLRSLPPPPTYVGTPQPLITFQPREGKRIPHFRKTLKEKEILHQLESLLAHNTFPDQICRDLIEPVVAGTPWVRKLKRYRDDGKDWHPLHHVGIIGFIQEPGFKLRAVANPNRILQLALEPLGRQLFKWLRKVPEDCCFHQDSGVYTVQGILGQRVRVHSVDLSNATDVFPYTLLEMVLASAKTPGSPRRLVKMVSKGSWLTPLKSTVSKSMVMRWNRGMPLGVFPCFALFSLGHHALVRGICVSLGRTDFPYRILGDDVVIWDDSVAEEYKRVLGLLGCPIALEKSISSELVAEFAGRVIQKDSILHGLKYGDENHDNSFLEQVKNMGPRTIRYLLPKQRQVARWLSEAAEPIGFGYNPRGLPYRERLAKALAWELSAPRKSSVAVTVQISQAIRNWYSYKYSEVRRWSGGMDPKHSRAWDPLGVVQTPDTAHREWLAIAAQGNLQEILQLQSLEEAVKGPAGWLVKLILEVNTLQDQPDHPFNKPLIQSLYPRLQRARVLVPGLMSWLEQFDQPQ